MALFLFKIWTVLCFFLMALTAVTLFIEHSRQLLFEDILKEKIIIIAEIILLWIAVGVPLTLMAFPWWN